MRVAEKLGALRAVLGFESFRKGDECIFFCPKHPHHKPKLSVNVKNDNFHCWICGFKGTNLKPLLYLRGRTDEADRYVETFSGRISEGRVSEGTQQRTFHPVVLPAEFKSLSSTDAVSSPYGRHALRYLRGRGLQHNEVIRFKLGYCDSGRYAGRIIIPSFDSGGDLNFFVGRKFYDWAGLAYKHEDFDKNIIFNDYLIDWDETVTLVEGPFDSFVAENSVPLQGTILREDSVLFGKIVTSGTRVCLALDADARQKQLKIAKLLMSYGVEVGVVEVEDYGVSDVGEMSRDQFSHAVGSALWLNGELDVLRLKVRA